ncbi:formylglycine-generating enzyme family protein [Paraburkholderia sp. IW21]|uniref:formylglycine-generating enzyme family protein n=1 Tax=Paraburkholderia sp. IW21 TaxID=3242488 RepID=UPI00351FC228
MQATRAHVLVIKNIVKEKLAFLALYSLMVPMPRLGRIILPAAFCLASVASEGKETLDALKHFKDCDVCSEMVVIPAGEYMMGARKEDFEGERNYTFRYADETPLHPVSIKSFGIAKFDVTRKQFSVFAKETAFDGRGCSVYNGKWWWPSSRADWKNPGFTQSDDDPVVCVSWADAQKFIAWLNSKAPAGKIGKYRLPTEAEWEYAARAGTVARTYWGGARSEQCKYANTRDISARDLDPEAPYVNCEDGYVETSPVGSFRPNSWGLYDMLGNAYQWVSDCFKFTYSTDPEDLHFPDCSKKTARGASWATIPTGVRSSVRHVYKTEARDSTVGFRIAVDL